MNYDLPNDDETRRFGAWLDGRVTHVNDMHVSGCTESTCTPPSNSRRVPLQSISCEAPFRPPRIAGSFFEMGGTGPSGGGSEECESPSLARNLGNDFERSQFSFGVIPEEEQPVARNEVRAGWKDIETCSEVSTVLEEDDGVDGSQIEDADICDSPFVGDNNHLESDDGEEDDGMDTVSIPCMNLTLFDQLGCSQHGSHVMGLCPDCHRAGDLSDFLMCEVSHAVIVQRCSCDDCRSKKRKR